MLFLSDDTWRICKISNLSNGTQTVLIFNLNANATTVSHFVFNLYRICLHFLINYYFHIEQSQIVYYILWRILTHFCYIFCFSYLRLLLLLLFSYLLKYIYFLFRLFLFIRLFLYLFITLIILRLFRYFLFWLALLLLSVTSLFYLRQLLFCSVLLLLFIDLLYALDKFVVLLESMFYLFIIFGKLVPIWGWLLVWYNFGLERNESQRYTPFEYFHDKFVHD